MEITNFNDSAPENHVSYKEFFGPVALFFIVKDAAEVIALAKNSTLGLGGSVFTQAIEKGKRVADQIDTGMVCSKHLSRTQSDLPFGGTKEFGVWQRDGTIRFGSVCK